MVQQSSSNNTWIQTKQLAAFQIYKMWRAVDLHFTSPSYDYFKYSGEVKLSFETFTKGKYWKDAMRLNDWIKRESLEPLKAIYALQSHSNTLGVHSHLGDSTNAWKAVYKAWDDKYGTRAKMNALKEQYSKQSPEALLHEAIKDSAIRDEIAYTLYFKPTDFLEHMNTFESRMYEILLKRQMFYVLFYTG